MIRTDNTAVIANMQKQIDGLQAQNAQLVEALKGCLNMVNGDGQPPNWDGLRVLLAEIEKDK